MKGKGGRFGGHDVKSGGRTTQKSAGASPSGRPTEKMGGGSRGEFAIQTAGSDGCGSAPDKRFSNRSGGEFSTAQAGK